LPPRLFDTVELRYGTKNDGEEQHGARAMVTKIAVEEHCLTPGFEDYWAPTVVDLPAKRREEFYRQLTDFGETRLLAMDKAGVERSVLAIAGPGVQAERDGKMACARASESNDFLAREISKRPDRYCGFAHLPMQDAQAAAAELERCMNELKFCGAMINGHTNGQYLDHPTLFPFWERAEALGALIYLHPADPVAPAPVLDGHKGLRRATWEWTFETGSHALRLIFGGVFDRFPRARLALGHLGETLPFLLWRFDSRAGPDFYAVKLAKLPSEYVKDNIVVATSGMCSADPLACTISALGHDRVMFAADYPFESLDEAARFIEAAPIGENVRTDICFNNAARIMRLR
jgi:2,3-dihydroxybenzoate decarboxylase